MISKRTFEADGCQDKIGVRPLHLCLLCALTEENIEFDKLQIEGVYSLQLEALAALGI